VELWFSKIERDVIARGVFKTAKPFRWAYADPTRRIA